MMFYACRKRRRRKMMARRFVSEDFLDRLAAPRRTFFPPPVKSVRVLKKQLFEF